MNYSDVAETKLKQPRVRGRVKHSSFMDTHWIELTPAGIRVRRYHCHKSKTLPLQTIIDLAAGQLPLL